MSKILIDGFEITTDLSLETYLKYLLIGYGLEILLRSGFTLNEVRHKIMSSDLDDLIIISQYKHLCIDSPFYCNNNRSERLNLNVIVNAEEKLKKEFLEKNK